VSLKSKAVAASMHLELHQTSGLGVRPARASASECDTTRSQYSSVNGTTSSGTLAALHTYTIKAEAPFRSVPMQFCGRNG